MTLVLQDRTLKALSLILSYPTKELQKAMPEIGGVLSAERRLTAAARRALRPLLDELQTRDIYDLEEQYVMLFDRSRALLEGQREVLERGARELLTRETLDEAALRPLAQAMRGAGMPPAR